MAHPLHIAFIWHMHQPAYRDPVSGACSMPWARLHGTKDYLDMVRRLEAYPSIHQTFNLVPSLLDQLEAYLPPASGSDEFLDLSRKPAAELTEREIRFILQWFFLANPERMIRPYPRYHDLLAKRGLHVAEEEWPKIARRFKTQDLLDLQVWFNLAWIDPWLRAQDARLSALEQKGAHFTEADKAAVLRAHLELLARILPAYREAAAKGQVELTTSPYYHPIMPLLCDVRSALAALPNLSLPQAVFRHPEDAQWQLREAIARHQASFGQPPAGVWPPEGSVSEEFVKLAIDARCHWIATDEEILWRTLKAPRSPSLLYRPHLLRRTHGQLAIVFRDRELSDLIGFVYSRWEARAAAADFINRLGEIHQQFRTSKTPALVSVILDGENAWEYYPHDGHEFLTSLYQALATDERFRCVTVSDFLQQHPLDHAESLPELSAGSWIDGNFATWIGHPEKNTAWTHLATAREALGTLNLDDPAQRGLRQSLGMAEGSDWMWWFGDTHVSAQAQEFDRLFRTHLANVYRLGGREIPEALGQPIRRPSATPIHHPTGLIRATIDGRETSYYEWLYAGTVDLRSQYAAIHRGEQLLQRLHYGFDERHCYLRIDVDLHRLTARAGWMLHLALGRELRVQIQPAPDGIRAQTLEPSPTVLPCALDRLLELAIPIELLGLREGEPLELSLSLSQGGEVVERHPIEGTFQFVMSVTGLETQLWSA